jgi:hypothetical protein
MLQTGHSDRNSIPNTVRRVTESLQQSPAMPVINGEVCYEGIAEASRQEVQRFHVLGLCAERSGRAHVWGQRNLADQHDRKTLRPFAPWALLG